MHTLPKSEELGGGGGGGGGSGRGNGSGCMIVLCTSGDTPQASVTLHR